MKWLWIAIVPAALLLASLPLSADSDKKPGATATTYTVNVKTEVKSKEDSKSDEEYTVTVYVLPEVRTEKRKKKKVEVVEYRMAFVVEGDLDESKNLSLGTMTRGENFVGTDLEHPQGRLISRCFQPFFDNPVDPEHVKSLGSGDHTRDIEALALSKVAMKYKAKAGNGPKDPVRYQLKLAEAPVNSRRGTMETTLNEYLCQYQVEPTTLRLVKSKVKVDYMRSYGGNLYERKETITITEDKFEELKASEAKKVMAELQILEPLAEVTLGGGVDYLRRNADERKKLTKSLESYKKKHAEKGYLAKAFPRIESTFNLNLKKSGVSANPEDIARAMLKENAPAFTLKNLAGERVSLSDFKGKTVLLNFWAVL